MRYYMDYLFGGQIAYNALVAANNAANEAFVATKAGTLAGQTITVVTSGTSVNYMYLSSFLKQQSAIL